MIHYLSKLRLVTRRKAKPCWKTLAANSRSRFVPSNYSDNTCLSTWSSNPSHACTENQYNGLDVSGLSDFDFFTKGPWVQASAALDAYTYQTITKSDVCDLALLQNAVAWISQHFLLWWRPWYLFMVWVFLSRPTFFVYLLVAQYFARQVSFSGKDAQLKSPLLYQNCLHPTGRSSIWTSKGGT
jgi:hypothetical protein